MTSKQPSPDNTNCITCTHIHKQYYLVYICECTCMATNYFLFYKTKKKQRPELEQQLKLFKGRTANCFIEREKEKSEKIKRKFKNIFSLLQAKYFRCVSPYWHFEMQKKAA